MSVIRDPEDSLWLDSDILNNIPHHRRNELFCTDKDDTLVRYSVLCESQQLFASKYRLVLPGEEELRDELERRHILQLPDSGNSPNG